MKEWQWPCRSSVRLHLHFLFLCFYPSCKWFPELFRFAKHAMILMKQTWTLTCDFILKSTTCVEVHRFLGFNVSFFPFLFLFFSFFFLEAGGGGGRRRFYFYVLFCYYLFIYFLFWTQTKRASVHRCLGFVILGWLYYQTLTRVNRIKKSEIRVSLRQC